MSSEEVTAEVSKTTEEVTELGEGFRLVSITIPEGKKPGDEFTYKDDECEMEIVVPEDSKAGDTMEILIDDNDDGIEGVEVDLNPHIDLTLNFVTFMEDDIVEVEGENEDGEDGEAKAPLTAEEKKEEPVEAESDDEEDDVDGTNFMLWPAGHEMAKFIVRPSTVNTLIQERSNVLELGSGCGVTGMALSAALARRESGKGAKVYLSDLPMALPLLAANLEENQEAIVAEKSNIEISTSSLTWGEEEDLKQFGDDKFDLIVGSDLIYNSEKEIMTKLSKTIDTLLDPENGLVLLAIRWREYEEERFFFEEMERLGYEFVLASKRIESLGGGIEENNEQKNSDLSWQEFGSEKSEASKKYFAETKYKVNGEEKCLSEIAVEDTIVMEEEDFDNFELTHIQIYAGYKK